jgi:hypothetical protein
MFSTMLLQLFVQTQILLVSAIVCTIYNVVKDEGWGCIMIDISKFVGSTRVPARA